MTKQIEQEELIAAVATPFGEGALGIVRLSGAGCLDALEKVFRPAGRLSLRESEPGRQRFGRVVDPENGGTIDEVVLIYNEAPRSFTGEDVAEITCHGGIVVTRQVLDVCLHAGARMAHPGEFSQRAFLNGKMDLTQAEAIMDLISARTELAARAAAEQLEGRLGSRIQEMRAALLEILAHVEAYIDFPEEDIAPETGGQIAGRMREILAGLEKLLATAEEGRILREGVRTVICGEPNAGKSSLLNQLLGFERAIVSQTAGTTRDSIEEAINLRGIPVILTDTAGLRQEADDIEKLGIERTMKILDRADLVLLVADASAPRGAEFERVLENCETRVLPVLNKIDLPEHDDWREAGHPRVSALTGHGMEELSEALHAKITSGGLRLHESAVAINERHRQCLDLARANMQKALHAFEEEGLSPEFVAVDLHEALDHIGDIVGRADTEEILGEIFARFCIGK